MMTRMIYSYARLKSLEMIRMALLTYLAQYTWWGKLLGAGLGFLMAGPSGALFGIFIGNLFDRGLSEHFSRPHGSYHTEKRAAVKKTFQRSTFLIMGHLCKVDGYVSKEEIQIAKKIMRELHLSRIERTSAQQFFTQGKAPHFKINEPLDLLKNLTRNNPKLLREFVQLQYRVAQVGGLTSGKIKVLNHVLQALDLAPLHKQAHAREKFYTYFNQGNQWQQNNGHSNASAAYAGPPVEDAYTLLNISQSANQQEVKRAYRRKISLHHPDKQIAKGHSAQHIKKANEQTQAIRKAYESICQERGW